MAYDSSSPEQTRCDIGKAPSPTVAIIDSQSVKTTELATSRGFDAHKKVKGRKRHIVTDTIGIPLGVKVTDANVSDNQVAIELLTEVKSTSFPISDTWLIKVATCVRIT